MFMLGMVAVHGDYLRGWHLSVIDGSAQGLHLGMSPMGHAVLFVVHCGCSITAAHLAQKIVTGRGRLIDTREWQRLADIGFACRAP
jgi:hypothetical protein